MTISKEVSRKIHILSSEIESMLGELHTSAHADPARHAQAEILLHSEKLHAHMSRQDYLQALDCLYYIGKCYLAKEHADFQAKMESLNEQTKRLRGRPPTGNAMTDAEKQRAYRERRAAARAEKAREVEKLREQLHLEHMKNAELVAEIDQLSDQLEALRAKK